MAFFVFKRKFKCNLKNVDKEYVFMFMNKPPVIFEPEIIFLSFKIFLKHVMIYLKLEKAILENYRANSYHV